MPTSLTVVGGGVIGTEYACLFAALGTKVVLVEGRDRLLAGVDEELSTVIQLSLERMGAQILLGDAVESVEREPGATTNALRLKLKSGRRVRADKLLFSAGRTGNTKGMNLEAIGVALNERGQIRVDEHFRTAAPGIYAVGDVIGFPALASTSMEQGRVAMCHAFDLGYKTGISPVLPYGIYSIPEISSVGPSEQELKEKGIAYEIGRARFENNARGQVTGDADGMIKLLFDPESKRLLAAHILGEDATELVHIPMLVMAPGGTIDASSTRSSTSRRSRRGSSTPPTTGCSGWPAATRRARRGAAACSAIPRRAPGSSGVDLTRSAARLGRLSRGLPHGSLASLPLLDLELRPRRRRGWSRRRSPRRVSSWHSPSRGAATDSSSARCAASGGGC